jgi:hypothetical protein
MLLPTTSTEQMVDRAAICYNNMSEYKPLKFKKPKELEKKE